MVNVLVPFFRVNEEGANFAIDRNLSNVRLSMAGKAVLVWV
jgi:hypothetical protein